MRKQELQRRQVCQEGDWQKETRAKQEVERAEWQELLKKGYKIDQDGKLYHFKQDVD